MQIDKTSIAGKIPSFPVESQLSIGSRAKHTLHLNYTKVKKDKNFNVIN